MRPAAPREDDLLPPLLMPGALPAAHQPFPGHPVGPLWHFLPDLGPQERLGDKASGALGLPPPAGFQPGLRTDPRGLVEQGGTTGEPQGVATGALARPQPSLDAQGKSTTVYFFPGLAVVGRRDMRKRWQGSHTQPPAVLSPRPVTVVL